MVELREVSKSFGATRALRGVSLTVARGEVHGLAGANGAGKSTLLRVLCGVYPDYQGEIRIDGAVRRLRGPADAARAGIAAIHQELALVAPMTVADNLLLGSETRALALRRPRTRAREAERMLAAVGLELGVDLEVGTLPLATRQQLEIARALGRGARVLVMDEPTSALGEQEREKLFERIEALRAQGNSILYISHRLDELERLADRITVLRDGERVLSAVAKEIGRERLVEAMGGETVGRPPPRPSPASGGGSGLLEVDGLSLEGRGGARAALLGVSLALRRGEVLGIAGLPGAGASELLHAIFGSFGVPPSGRARLAGAPLALGDPRGAIAAGVVLVSGDRAHSAVLPMSVRHNVTLARLGALARFGWIARARETREARAACEGCGVQAPLSAALESLSGGNQQKVVLARALACAPRVLLLDEPLRGIDVAAKADIGAVLAELRRAGTGMLLASSDFDELCALSDRVLVLVRGRVAARFDAPPAREALLAAALEVA